MRDADEAIDDLLARAEEAHLTGAPVVACALAQEAVARLEEAEHWARIPEAAGLLAHSCALTGEIHRAEGAYLTAGLRQRALAEGDQHLHGRPGSRWGWYLRKTYRWSDAREVLERSEVLCHDEGRPADAALAALELAALELDRKNPRGALARVEQALPLLSDAGYVADAVRARLLTAEVLVVQGRLSAAEQLLEVVLDDCQTHGLLTTRIEALVIRSRLTLAAGGTTHDAAAEALSAWGLALDRRLVWLQIDALWALAAADDLGRVRAGEDPLPADAMPRPGSFADQAARLRQRLDNQWFDLHPVRTVEERLGR